MENPDKKETLPGGDDPGDAMSDIVTAVGFLFFALLMFAGATQFTYQEEMGFVTSAGFTPMLLAVIVSLLSIFLIIRTFKRNKASLVGFSVWLRKLSRDEVVRRSIVLILITGGYIVLVGVAPFLPLTFLFLCGIYYYLKIGGIIRTIIYSLTNALLIAYAIPWVYQMPLP